MFENLKAKNGITLIALVITIIIMMILTGVTLSLIFSSDNGIITKARKAKEATEESTFHDTVSLMASSYKLNLMTESAESAKTKLIADINSNSYEYQEKDNNIIIRHNNHAGIINLTSGILTKQSSENLSWLLETEMIVTDETESKYSRVYPELEKGTVFLNYNTTNKTIYNARDLSLASSQTGLTLLSAYYDTGNAEYLNRARLIGNNTLNNKVYEKNYLHNSSTEPVKLTCISPQLSLQSNNKWSYDNSCYTYPLDSLMSCKFLIELSKATEDSSYAETALNVIDSWIYIQSQIGTGALPCYIYQTESSWSAEPGMWPNWTMFPLDISYSLYLAGTSAYNYTNNQKYQKFVDDYFSFVEKSFDDYDGTFSFTKNSQTCTLPYEYICLSGSSYTGMNELNHGDYSDSKTNDITTDQLFYTVLGYSMYNPTSEYTNKFYNTISQLQFNNGQFYGEYSISGEMSSFEETTVETINSGFYIRLSKILNKTTELDNIKGMLESNKIISSDKTSNNSWTWNIDDNQIITEAVATSVLLQELYTSGMP